MLASLFFCIGSLLAAAAHAQDTFQLFGGYSYVRPAVTVIETSTGSCQPGPPLVCFPVVTPVGTHPNLNGWGLSATYNPIKWLGTTADFSGQFGSAQGATVHLQTYLFGPQVRFPGRVSPFAHVLFGDAHESLGANSLLGISPASANAFAVAAGAGIDIKVAHFVSLRPIQLDYLATRFGSATQNQARLSAGVVLHL
jgi:hypothetical protein